VVRHIHGVAHEVVESLKSKYVPNDSSAEIELETELEKSNLESLQKTTTLMCS
jgi:hypothetical protein